MCPQSPFWKHSLLKPALLNLDKKPLSLLSPRGFLHLQPCCFDSFLPGIHLDHTLFSRFVCVISTNICEAPGWGMQLWAQGAERRGAREGARQEPPTGLWGTWSVNLRHRGSTEEVQLRLSRWIPQRKYDQNWRMSKSEGGKPRRKGTPRGGTSGKGRGQGVSREQRVYPSNPSALRPRETL